MKIGLFDVDGHNFPNLALMKLSAWHKRKGDNVEFINNFFKYDIVYKSKVFTYSKEDQTVIKADHIIEGGTGYNFNVLSDEVEHILPDYDLYDCEHAYGFLTRGCPNKCSWCIVPNKEGDIIPNADISEFIGDKKSAVLMDNNVLASEHGLKQIEKIIDMKIKVDFNQGLDARLIDNDIAKLLSKVKWIYRLRMACDTLSAVEPLLKAVELLRKYNCKCDHRFFVYLLVKDISDTLKRIAILKENNIDMFAQPFIDYQNNIMPTREQKRLARYVNHKAIFKSVKYEDYLTLSKGDI